MQQSEPQKLASQDTSAVEETASAPCPEPAVGQATDKPAGKTRKPVREIGGRDGPDPVRYGDWEKGGRCIDF